MKRIMKRKIYIYQQDNWPDFYWDIEELAFLLS